MQNVALKHQTTNNVLVWTENAIASTYPASKRVYETAPQEANAISPDTNVNRLQGCQIVWLIVQNFLMVFGRSRE